MVEARAAKRSTSSRATRERYVALLRGINVGGKHSLPMKELELLCGAAGCQQVQTYIQSGNVVFAATTQLAKRLPALLAQRIAERFGFPVPVIVRSASELRALVTANPFLKAGASSEHLHVAFLAELPTKIHGQRLDPQRSPPDECALAGRHIYLHLPNGVGRSKYTNAYFDATLATTSTVRNWRTVLELLARAEG